MKIKDKVLKEVLNEQKKTNDILIELSKKGITMNGRQWRSFVREYNDNYSLHDRYIASNNQGYYLTTNKKKITKTAINKFKNGLSMMRNAKMDLEELSNKNQLSLLQEDADIYDMIMRL